MTEKINNNEIINSNKDEIKQEGNIINDSKVSYEEKKETSNQINSFEAETKITSLSQSDSNQKPQENNNNPNLVIEGLKVIGCKTSKEYFAEMEKKRPILQKDFSEHNDKMLNLLKQGKLLIPEN